LLVEQDVQIALERAERGYVIENGRIVLSGSANALMNSPQVRAAYLGEQGISLPGEPTEAGG